MKTENVFATQKEPPESYKVLLKKRQELFDDRESRARGCWSWQIAFDDNESACLKALELAFDLRFTKRRLTNSLFDKTQGKWRLFDHHRMVYKTDSYGLIKPLQRGVLSQPYGIDRKLLQEFQIENRAEVLDLSGWSFHCPNLTEMFVIFFPRFKK